MIKISAPAVSKYQIFHFQLPLRQPIVVHGHTITKRHGILLALTDHQGHQGYGEISPLPGLHPESLNDAEQQLVHFLSCGLDLDQNIWRWAETQNLYGSVRFGIETAWLNLAAIATDTHPCQSLADHWQERVTINGLLSGTRDTIEQDAIAFQKTGVKTVKLKVARQSIAEDVATVHRVRELMGPDVHIRLDANGIWSLPEAIEFGKQVNHCALEYLEDPVANLADFSKFYQATGIPIAIDTPSQGKNTAIKDISGLKAMIIRPSLLGGLLYPLKIFKNIQSPGIQVVISSSYESGVGLAALVYIAACLGEVAMGLDTYRWLAKDLLLEPILIRAGTIGVQDVFQKSQVIQMNSLTP